MKGGDFMRKILAISVLSLVVSFFAATVIVNAQTQTPTPTEDTRRVSPTPTQDRDRDTTPTPTERPVRPPTTGFGQG